MKTVNNAERYISEIITNAEKEKHELQALVDSDVEMIQGKKKQMEDAANVGDLAEYRRIKGAMQENIDAYEMHKGRMERLQHSPLISREEYDQKTGDIIAEYNAAEAEAKAQLIELAEGMKKIADKLEEEQEAVNKTLEKIQENLFKNEDRKKAPDGSFYAYDKKEVKYSDAIHWGRIATSHPLYSQFVGAEKHVYR